MSNVEWGLLVAAGFTTDAVQLALDAALVGPFVNWLIDLVVFMSLTLIYHLKGVNKIGKINGKFLTTAGGFILDGLGVGALPLWGVDILGVMALDKLDKKLPKLPI